MASINSRETVDTLIANNGIYPGDEDMPVVRIVQYNNMFDGRVTYGLVYSGEALDRYHASPACLNPKTIWDAEAAKNANGDH